MKKKKISRKKFGIYSRRAALLEKYVDSKERPTDKELEEAYGYLDYCLECGKPFTFWDRISFNKMHTFTGNFHSRDCHKEIKKNDK